MKYDIIVKDSECSPMLPGNGKLELGDMVSVTDMKNKTTHTFIVAGTNYKEVDACTECDADMVVGCISVRKGDSKYDSECAAPITCVFRSIDKIMERL